MNKTFTKEDLKNLLVIAIGFQAIGLYFEIDLLLWVVLIVLTLALIFVPFGKLVLRAWFGIAHVLGWINSKVILGVMFYLFLTPISFIYRIFNSDSLQLKDNHKSLFHDRDHVFEQKDFDNPW